MSQQFSVAVRNARANSFASTAGSSATLLFYDAAPPADCSAADTGNVLATLTLPATYMAAASAGAVALTGVWSGVSSAIGVIAGYRLKDSSGVAVHAQGTVTNSGSGGDMTVDSTTISSVGQSIQVLTFGWTEPNA